MRSLTSRSRARLIGVSLCLLLLAAGLFAPGLQQGVLAQDSGSVYLPIILGPTPDLYGTVTAAGQPVGGVEILLRRYQSNSGLPTEDVATAVTDANGVFHFWNAAKLPPGYRYYAAYHNGDGLNPSVREYAWYCSTFSLEDYEGDSVRMGAFDIANIELVAPEHEAKLKLPITFSWSHPRILTGTYTFNLFQPGVNDGPYYYTSTRDGAQSFTLEQLPPGFTYSTPYGWDVSFDTDEAYCTSHFYSVVTFRKK